MAQMDTKKDEAATTGSGFKIVEVKEVNSNVEVTIEIPGTVFTVEEEKSFAKLAQDVKIAGFRPGKAPKEMLRAQLGAAPYEAALNELLPKATLEAVNYLTESKGKSYVPISQVHYHINKVQPSTGVKFIAHFDIFPSIELGDFTKIKVTKAKSEVSDEEVANVLDQMFSDWKKENDAKVSKEEKSVEAEDKDAKDDNKSDTKKKNAAYTKPTDEWVKDELAMDDIKTLADLKQRIKEELLKTKDQTNENEYIDSMIKEAINLSKIEVSDSLINAELDNQEAAYKQRIENVGMKVDEFLKQQNTTMEALRTGWKPQLEERIKADLLIMEIAKKYQLTVSVEEVQQEIDAIPDENMKGQYSTDEGRRYIMDIHLRQKAINKLREIVEGDGKKE